LKGGRGNRTERAPTGNALEDVQQVFANFDLSDEVLATLE
jgi:hypothetical protein